MPKGTINYYKICKNLVEPIIIPISLFDASYNPNIFYECLNV